MIVYLVMTAVSVGFAAILQRSSDTGVFINVLYFPGHRLEINRKYILAFLSFLPVLLVSGFRYQIGTDYQSYIDIANEIIINGSSNRVEIGYNLFSNLVFFIWKNPFFMIFITCLLSYSLVYKTIIDLSPSVTFSVYYFITAAMLFPSFNMIRQFIAIAITFFAMRWTLHKTNWFKFFTCVLLAILFHKTALIVVPIWLLAHLQLKRKHYLAMIVSLLVIFVFRDEVLRYIMKIFYPSYIESRYFNRILLNELQIISSILLVILVFYYRPIIIDRYNFATKIINLSYFRAMVAILLAWVPMLWRFLIYLDITALVTIPLVINCEQNRKIRRFYYFLFAGMSTVYFWYSARFRNSHNVFPYKDILGFFS